MVSGYMRVPSRAWDPEHFQARWTTASPAPAWWVGIDIAWSIDREEVPSAREAGRLWGCSKSKASEIIREALAVQLEWETRADKRAFLQRMLARGEERPEVRGRSVDKTQTTEPELQGRDADTGHTANAENPQNERTPGGRSVDEPRTDGGRLVRASSFPPTATATATGGSAREESDREPEPPPTPPRVMPDDLGALMPTLRHDMLTRLVRNVGVEEPSHLLAMTVSQLAHSPGMGWGPARAVERALALEGWSMAQEPAREPRARGRPAAADPAPPRPLGSPDPASPDFDPRALEEQMFGPLPPFNPAPEAK